MSEFEQRLAMMLNLSRYHREHEKFYARAPLERAVELHKVSGVLKTPAGRWAQVEARQPQQGDPYMRCEDLNEPSTIQHSGVLFMASEGEPAEIADLKCTLESAATGFGQTGEWLANAMERFWDDALALLQIPSLAGFLGERHRIITNDWQAANLSHLVSPGSSGGRRRFSRG